jgi:hypothetical protein
MGYELQEKDFIGWEIVLLRKGKKSYSSLTQ